MLPYANLLSVCTLWQLSVSVHRVASCVNVLDVPMAVMALLESSHFIEVEGNSLSQEVSNGLDHVRLRMLQRYRVLVDAALVPQTLLYHHLEFCTRLEFAHAPPAKIRGCPYSSPGKNQHI